MLDMIKSFLMAIVIRLRRRAKGRADEPRLCKFPKNKCVNLPKNNYD